VLTQIASLTTAEKELVYEAALGLLGRVGRRSGRAVEKADDGQYCTTTWVDDFARRRRRARTEE